MDILRKSILYFKKPKVIVVMHDGKRSSAKAILQVLKTKFVTKKFQEKVPDVLNLVNTEIFVIETDFRNSEFVKEVGEFVKKSQLPVLVVSNIETFELSQNNFSDEEKKIERVKTIAKQISPHGSLILNFDNKMMREIGKITNVKSFSFGFSNEADFRASDIFESDNGTTFKLNYKGNIVPIWLNNVYGKEEICNALSAICVGMILGLNVVEMSESLKSYNLFLEK